MKFRKHLSFLLCAALLLGILSGCGASSTSASYAVKEEAMEAPAMMAGGVANDALTDTSRSDSLTLPESRKWIITMYLSAETEDLDAMTAALDEHITALNGYVEDQHVYNGSAYSGRRYRSANLTVRIPAENADRFTEEVSHMANVISREKNLEDITLNYVSTESRMTALRTEEARLLELMAQAETMSDLLEIEARLTDVRYELERVTSQLRTYDNQINYATIHLDISEVQEYTPVEEPTLWQRIRDGFGKSLKDLGESLQDLLVFLVVASPFLLVYGIIILAIVLLVRRILKKRPGERKVPRKIPEKENDKT